MALSVSGILMAEAGAGDGADDALVIIAAADVGIEALLSRLSLAAVVGGRVVVARVFSRVLFFGLQCRPFL